MYVLNVILTGVLGTINSHIFFKIQIIFDTCMPRNIFSLPISTMNDAYENIYENAIKYLGFYFGAYDQPSTPAIVEIEFFFF